MTGTGPVLAIGIGGTRTSAALVNDDAGVNARQAIPTPGVADGGPDDADAIVSQLVRLLEGVVAEGPTRPIALGVAAPGPVDASSGRIIEPPNLGPAWCGLELGPLLRDRLGLSWGLERVTVASIRGEQLAGVGRGTREVAYLMISTGVGGAVISDGRLTLGPDGVGGELGHMVIDMDGPACSCGGFGHVESFGSGNGIVRAARRALEDRDAGPELHKIAAERVERGLRAEDVSRAADLGDRSAGVILERARRAVALAVVSIVNVFGPDVVILGGGIALAWREKLLAPVREAVIDLAFTILARRGDIVHTELGYDAGLVGALAVAGGRTAGGHAR